MIILNVGFGMIELAAGFLAASQALKADALDFLGDGSITFIGLLALGWTASTRARVALAQGLFLAALGVSVIGAAIWRMFDMVQPEAGIMGWVGFVALLINLAAVFVLARFRKGGDAQARAIWLFSRNDALANVAVIVAAGLVYWLGSAWPDIIVAAAIAFLFLHSALEIIRHARSDMKTQQIA
ncbi:cation transporter [Citromicrobium sp. JLT1363]|uniref:cation transporter n=1 Tax=Citromicrobium sp. JLT1363 TaxID=517722 RepID=UPI000225E781